MTHPVESARLLATVGRHDDAIVLLRQHLVANPSAADAAVALAYLMLERRRPLEAIKAIEPLAARPDADLETLTAYGAALAAMGRSDDAIAVYTRGTRMSPKSGVAEHNLAANLGDAHRFAESEQAARRAMAKGLNALETWLVYARALKGGGAYDEAEVAFRRIINRKPTSVEAHGDLAQLIWMRTEDADRATVALDTALTVNARDAGLTRVKAKFLESIGKREAAYAALEESLASRPSDPRLDVEAVQLIGWTDGDRALMHAERAARAAPDRGDVRTALCLANLAAGRPDAAAQIADGLRRDWPQDQYPVALSATAWRMQGDARYGALYDYQRLVDAGAIDTPKGWSSLTAYLDDLKASLATLRRLRGHPIGQSLRQGAQTEQTLTLSTDPVIRAFFEAVDGSIRRYIDQARPGEGGFGRSQGVGSEYKVSGTWSVSLRPGGFHINHLHPRGWISSACHIDLPEAVERGREGWLAFGEPGVATRPQLPAEHFVKPKAGHLVLFPSYMWHGTIPFTGNENRVGVAFDVVPA